VVDQSSLTTREIEMLLHKHGGTITSVSEIGHETYKGVANWFFIGNVEWNDGSRSEAIQIAPIAVCYETEADKPKVDALGG
jgi:hypothetical protein